MMNLRSLPRIVTERLVIKLLEPADSTLMATFRVQNKAHLTQWEPTRTPEFYTSAFWQLQLRVSIREFKAGASMCLAILNSTETEVIGVCNYTNIVRGTFQSCHLGYGLAERHQGKGLMFEALQPINDYIFAELGLHRIMANYMPVNARSGDLLRRLGFTVEGEAKAYLKIDGQWEDHILTSLINAGDSRA